MRYSVASMSWKLLLVFFAVLLALFVVAQCQALGRGLEIPCGCFGTSKYEPVDAWTIARTVGLLGIAVLALAVRRQGVRDGRVENGMG